MAEIETPEIPQEDIDLIQQLKTQGLPSKDIARQVFAQNYNFPIKALMEELALSGLEVGQAKAIAKREDIGRKSREGKETPKAEVPPRVATKATEPPLLEEEGATPAGREFANAIDQVLDKATTKWKSFIIKLYENQPPSIKQNRQQLEHFLLRHGLNLVQVAGICDLIMPEISAGFPQGQQAMAYNPQTGQYIPVILPSQGGQGGNQGYPQGGPSYFVNSPQNPPPAMSSAEITLIIRDTIAAEIAKAEAAKPRPVPEPAPPHVPYRRIPIMDEMGNIMKDTSGQVVYQEVPYDPSMTMLEFLKPLFLQRPAPVKEVDEEKMLLKTREAFREEMKGNKGETVDTEKLVMKLTADIDAKLGPRLQSLEAESAARDRHQEITQAVRDATSPLVTQIQQLQSSQGLTLEERKVKQLTDTVTSTAKDVRADLRSLISQALVPTYAQMEKQYNLPEGSLVGPLLDQVKKEAPLPTAGDASRVLGAVEGWAKS